MIDPKLVSRTQTLTQARQCTLTSMASPPLRSDVATECVQNRCMQEEQWAKLRREERRSARCRQGCVRPPFGKSPNVHRGSGSQGERQRTSLPRSLLHPPGAPACTLSSCSHYSSRRARGSFSVCAHSSVHACRKVVSRVPSLLHFLFIPS